MLYTEGTSILTLSGLRALFPNTMFPPTGPDSEWMEENDIYPLTMTDAPSVDWDKVAEQDGVEEISGEWFVKWTIRNKTPQEIEQHHANIKFAIAIHLESLDQTIVGYGDLTPQLQSYCDKESVTGLDECIDNIMDNGGLKTISWEGPNGYTEANGESLTGLRKTVVDYRQKKRDAARFTLDDHESNPFNTPDDAILAFNSYMEE